MKKAILVDSNSLLYRAFYALPKFTSSDGMPTGGIYGFLRILSKLLKEPHSHFIVVGDSKGPLSRSSILKEYKCNRPKAPDELSVQRSELPQVLAALNIPYVVFEGKEADDSIASLSALFEHWGFDIDVYTSDTDMLQLISDHTRIVMFKKGITQVKIYDKSTFTDEYGFLPSRYVDYKALVGDQSDNIPGVNGIGPKTASSLMRESDRDAIKKKYGEIFDRNVELITLERFDVPLSIFLYRIKPVFDFGTLDDLQFRSLIPSLQKVLSPIEVQVSLFGLEGLSALPWQSLEQSTVVAEPFPFAFIKGQEPIMSSCLLFAQSSYSINNLQFASVFVDGEAIELNEQLTATLINAASSVKVDGNTLWIQA